MPRHAFSVVMSDHTCVRVVLCLTKHAELVTNNNPNSSLIFLYHFHNYFLINSSTIYEGNAGGNLAVPCHRSLSNLREPDGTTFTVFTHLTLCFKMIDTRDLGGKYWLLSTTIYIFWKHASKIQPSTLVMSNLPRKQPQIGKPGINPT